MTLMNPEVKASWIAALRSGEYQQGKGHLRDGSAFCCLGVLCDPAAKAGVGNWYGNTFDNCQKVLPENVMKWSGLTTSNGVISGDTLANLNDGGMSFTDIADVIEAEF